MRNLLLEREIKTKDQLATLLSTEIAKTIFVPTTNQLNLRVLGELKDAIKNYLLTNFPKNEKFVSNNSTTLKNWLHQITDNWEYLSKWSLTQRKGMIYFYVEGELRLEFPNIFD